MQTRLYPEGGGDGEEGQRGGDHHQRVRARQALQQGVRPTEEGAKNETWLNSFCLKINFQDTRFTEYEIVQLWSTFQRDFPSGKINRVQITQLIKNVFPK